MEHHLQLEVYNGVPAAAIAFTWQKQTAQHLSKCGGTDFGPTHALLPFSTLTTKVWYCMLAGKISTGFHNVQHVGDRGGIGTVHCQPAAGWQQAARHHSHLLKTPGQYRL